MGSGFVEQEPFRRFYAQNLKYFFKFKIKFRISKFDFLNFFQIFKKFNFKIFKSWSASVSTNLVAEAISLRSVCGGFVSLLVPQTPVLPPSHPTATAPAPK